MTNKQLKEKLNNFPDDHELFFFLDGNSESWYTAVCINKVSIETHNGKPIILLEYV